MGNRFHSVTLDTDACKGCINCIKRCPTEAIRVRDGKAHIITERCIDCGECIRVCPNHAKKAVYDSLSILDDYDYTIALPAPSLYGQFNNLDDKEIVLDALLKMGVDAVYEVAAAAEIVSDATRKLMKQGALKLPEISSACPAVVRLIQVRFPDLIPHIVDVRQPMEVAAMIARTEFCKKHNCEPADVGVFFITPCPAKMTAIRSPIGQQKACVDGAISMMEIYGLLRPYISQNAEDVEAEATSYGIGWAASSGEAKAVCPDNSLVVDGIENCSRVLEEIENNKLSDLVFFEGNACTGGCVGGPLTFENNYVAKNAIRKLVDNARQQRPERPAQSVPASMMTKYPLYMDAPILPNSAIQLDSDITVALDKMERINQILQDLPGYDCGSCGSPTCRTFAEDIVCGYCNEMFCIHKLKDRLKVMAQQMVELAQMKRE